MTEEVEQPPISAADVKRLVAAERRLRNEVAGSIHDEALQTMYAVLVSLDTLARSLSDDAAAERVATLREQFTGEYWHLRRRAFAALPPAWERNGLAFGLAAMWEESRTPGSARVFLAHRYSCEIEQTGFDAAHDLVLLRSDGTLSLRLVERPDHLLGVIAATEMAGLSELADALALRFRLAGGSCSLALRSRRTVLRFCLPARPN